MTRLLRRSAYLNVSQAAISTLKPFWINQKHTFDRLVLLPTPLTPTNTRLYGSRCWDDGRGEESLLRIESNRSVDVLGVNIRVSDKVRACRTVALIALGLCEYKAKRGHAMCAHFGNSQLSSQQDFLQHLHTHVPQFLSLHSSS